MPVIRLKSFLFLILAAFLCQLLPFLLNTSHAEPIRLDSSRERIPVAGQLELLKDEEGSLTITDITTLPVMARFKPIPGNHLSGFAQHGAVWLRITVIRPSDSPSPWLLEVNPAYHEQLQLYFRSDLQGYDRRDGGALLPFSKREIPYRLDLFRLYPPVDQPWTVYLRIVSKRTILSHLTFWQPDGLKKHAIAESLAHGAYLGILLLIICLNVQYALRLNKLLYLYYSAYVLAMAVIFLDFNGYLHQFLITDRTWFLSPCIRLNLILLMVSNVGVLSHLVDLKPLFPKINMFFSRFFLNMAALFTILVLAGQSDKIVILVLDTLLASAIISAGISVYLCFHRIMGAKLYLAAFGMLLLTGSAKILTFFDFVPEIFPADLFWISSLVHILIMNLAVTNRITQYRQDKLKFEAELAAERSTMNLQREFLQLISHELRTPLAIIDSTAQILPMVNTDQSVFKHKTATILEATHKMKLLLDRCLTNERIRDDKIVPVIQPTAFRSLVRNIADQAQKSAPKHDIFVELDALPENHSCDIFLIEILLNNLLDNAIKFSPGGGNIHLRGRLCEKNELILEIQDQGVGIPPEQIGLVFTQFFRTGQVASVQGSGLGLHLVQKIAQLHGGNVSCSSKLGVGSIFTVRLPVAE